MAIDQPPHPMMSPQYWIESITEPCDEGKQIAVLSCSQHGACILIHGTKFELILRVIRILNGLNDARTVFGR